MECGTANSVYTFAQGDRSETAAAIEGAGANSCYGVRKCKGACESTRNSDNRLHVLGINCVVLGKESGVFRINIYGGKCGAATEGSLPNGGYAGGDGDFGQSCTAAESVIAYCLYAICDGEGVEGFAIGESRSTYGFHTGWNRDCW